MRVVAGAPATCRHACHAAWQGTGARELLPRAPGPRARWLTNAALRALRVGTARPSVVRNQVTLAYSSFASFASSLMFCALKPIWYPLFPE